MLSQALPGLLCLLPPSLSAVASVVLVWVATARATGESLDATSSEFAALPVVGWAVIASRLLLLSPEEIQELSRCSGIDQQSGSGSCSAGTVAHGPRGQRDIRLNALVLPSVSSKTMLIGSLICFISNSYSNALFRGYI